MPEHHEKASSQVKIVKATMAEVDDDDDEFGDVVPETAEKVCGTDCNAEEILLPRSTQDCVVAALTRSLGLCGSSLYALSSPWRS